MFRTPPWLRSALSVALLLVGPGCVSAPQQTTVLSASGPPSPARAPASGQGVSRTLLEQHDLPDFPGWESRLYLVEYAPGVVAPVHHHPVAGWGYVITGAFESAFAGERPVVVHAGESFVERAGVPHLLFRNAAPAEPLKFVIAFVTRKGAPVLVTP